MSDDSHDPVGGDHADGDHAGGLGPATPPGRAHLLWDNGNGTAAVWRLGASGSGGGERRLFGPFAGWTARALAVGPDGRVFLLWTGRDRAASIWSVDMEAGAAQRGEAGGARHGEFGPYDGWEARTLAVGPDGTLRVLWAGADGAAALWSLPGWSLTGGSLTREGFGGGEPEALDCGPFAGWAARSLAVGPDNLAHLLWTRGDGAASVWRVGAEGRVVPSEYGPYAGWDAVGVAAGRDGASRLLWRSAGGYASLWDAAQAGGDDRAADERPQTVHGPFKGWSAVGVASAGAGGAAHLLWRHDGGGLASVWHLGAADGGGHEEYGPYAGWVPVALAVGP